MLGKTPKEHQMSIFEVALESFIDMNHELVLLSMNVIFGNKNKSAFLCPVLTVVA